MKHYIISVLAFVVGMVMVSGVAAELRIVTTIPDFGAIAKEIGKDKVSVTSLVRPTQDPHFVDAKPSFAVSLHRADALLLSGMELESGWLPPLMRNARNRRIQNGGAGYIDCSRFIDAKDIRAVDRAQGDIHPGGNPHYWTDPQNGIRIANGILAALNELAPESAAFFTANTSAFVKRLKQKMTQWRGTLNKQGPVNVVVYHESWTYFLEWAGYRQKGTLEPKPGVPPSPAHIVKLIQNVKRDNVRYVLQESFYPTNLSRLFAQKTGAQLKVLPTMVGAQGTTSYIDLIDTIVKEITQ